MVFEGIKGVTLVNLVKSWSQLGDQVSDDHVRTALYGVLGQREEQEETLYERFSTYMNQVGFSLEEDGKWYFKQRLDVDH